MDQRYERVVYHTGHEKSYKVCSEIAKASGFGLAHVKDYLMGTSPIVYGLFRGTDVPMREAYWAGIPFYYIDHGYFNRGHYDGYYRVCKDSLFATWDGQPAVSTKRFRDLNLMPRHLRTNSRTKNIVLICAPSLEGSMFLPFVKVWPEEWIEGIKHRFENMGYKVYVSTKHKNNTMEWFVEHHDIDHVVGHDSNVIVHALMQGYTVSNYGYQNVYHIRNDVDRNWFFHKLANEQFLLSEMTADVFV